MKINFPRVCYTKKYMRKTWREKSLVQAEPSWTYIDRLKSFIFTYYNNERMRKNDWNDCWTCCYCDDRYLFNDYI